MCLLFPLRSVRDIDRTRSCKRRVQLVIVKADKELVGFIRFAKGVVVLNIILMQKNLMSLC